MKIFVKVVVKNFNLYRINKNKTFIIQSKVFSFKFGIRLFWRFCFGKISFVTWNWHLDYESLKQNPKNKLQEQKISCCFFLSWKLSLNLNMKEEKENLMWINIFKHFRNYKRFSNKIHKKKFFFTSLTFIQNISQRRTRCIEIWAEQQRKFCIIFFSSLQLDDYTFSQSS